MNNYHVAAILSENENMNAAIDKAIKIISEKGDTVRTTEAMRFGIHPRTIYGLRDLGVLVTVTRGVYRLAYLPPLGDPDLALVAKRVPLIVMNYDVGSAVIKTFD
jgi:hypothetical protein